jgi:hypothetical protein
VLALLQLGCAALVEFPDDPQLAARGPWRCLTEPVERPHPTASTAHVRLPVCDVLLGCSTPLSELSGKLCAKLDPGCASPLPNGVSYANGAFSFDVPTGTLGFDGYLQITAPAAPCNDQEVFGDASSSLCALLPQCDLTAPDARCFMPTYAPSLRFFNPPIVADADLPPLSIATTATSLAIGRATGGIQDPSKGSLLVTAMDCDGGGAEGITLALVEQQDSEIRLLYTENGLLSTARRETDISGNGVFVGASPGYINVEGRDSAGLRIGGVGAQIVAGATSYALLLPSP